MIFNPHAVPPAVAALGLMLLGVTVLVRERFSRVSLAFFSIMVALSLWLSGITGSFSSNSEPLALWWLKFGFLGVPFIPSTIYLFSVVVMDIHARRKALVCFSFLASTFFVAAALRTDGSAPLSWSSSSASSC